MKRFALLAIVTLLTAGVAAAQTTGDMGNTATPGATYGTGIVVSSGFDALVLRRDDGTSFTALITKATVGAKEFPVGTRVRVDFHTNEQGQAVADVIQGLSGDIEPAPAKVVVTESPTPAPAAALTPAPKVRVTPPPATTTVITPTTATTTYAADNDQLPATAGNSTAVALFGLLAFAGAVALRATR
jgi:hypothetical protein